jgi:hypothetical protein
MTRTALLLCMALLSGCSYTSWRLDSSGGSASGSSVQVHVDSGSDLATLIGLGIVAAGMVEMERGRTHGFLPETRDAPPLAPDRKVTEHDCTRPLEELSGNLRCR